MKMIDLIAGDVTAVGGSGDTLLEKVIYWGSSTKTEKCVYSHTMIGRGQMVNPITGKVQTATFGADLLIKEGEWEPNWYKELRVYGWATPELQKIAAGVADQLFGELDGKLYGAQQYLFFGWRRLCNELGLPQRWAIRQWFKGDYICTTVAYQQLKRTAEAAGVSVSYPYGNGALTPLDIVHICEQLVAAGKMILRGMKTSHFGRARLGELFQSELATRLQVLGHAHHEAHYYSLGFFLRKGICFGVVAVRDEGEMRMLAIEASLSGRILEYGQMNKH